MKPEDPQDHREGGVQSNCCQAPVWRGDMCSECGEHCESEPADLEEGTETP